MPCVFHSPRTTMNHELFWDTPVGLRRIPITIFNPAASTDPIRHATPKFCLHLRTEASVFSTMLYRIGSCSRRAPCAWGAVW